MTSNVFTYFWFILLLSTAYSCQSIPEQSIIHSSDFYNGEVDATPAFVNMVEALKAQGGGQLMIDKGTYHFYPDKAFEKHCFISNHDDGLRSTPFPIIDMENVTIKGDDATFVFHGVMLPFLIEEAKNVSISGIRIDWEIPFHSEATVVANNKQARTFDIQISNNYPYTIRNGELIFLKEGYEHNFERAILWDPDTKAVAYNTVTYTPFEPYSKVTSTQFREGIKYPYSIVDREPLYRYVDKENKVFALEIAPGLVRISGTNKQLPEPGRVIVCKGRNGYNRIAPAFRVLQSKNLNLTDVKVHHAGGMGFIAEKCEDIKLTNVVVGLAEGSHRMLSTTADATHFVNCRGVIEMDGCVFANQLDDATNIHGTFVEITDRIDEYTVGVKLGHFQQLGFEFASSGDSIGFVNAQRNYQAIAKNKVKSLQTINKRYYKIVFEKPLTAAIQPGIVLDNLDWYPTVHIKNCTAVNNRARGFLISTPKPTVIEGCNFSNMMAAIFLPTELTWWYESGCAENLTIRNNTFKDCCYGGNKTAVIACHTNLQAEGDVYRNIVIENNTFQTFDKALLIAEKIDGLVFRNNVIKPSATYSPLRPNEPAILVKKCRNVTITDNQYGSSANFQISMDKESEQGAEVSLTWTSVDINL